MPRPPRPSELAQRREAKRARLQGRKAELKRERQRQRDEQRARDRSARTLKLPTQPDCAQLARLLMSGIPLDQSLSYLDPAYARLDQIEDAIERAAKKRGAQKRWLNSPLLAAEQSLLQGADWPDLDKDVRIRLAFDKHLAELAYLLYSKSYITAAPHDEAKMDSARQAIMKYLEVSTTDPEAPWMRAINDLIHGKIDGKPLEDVAKIARQES